MWTIAYIFCEKPELSRGDAFWQFPASRLINLNFRIFLGDRPSKFGADRIKYADAAGDT